MKNFLKKIFGKRDKIVSSIKKKSTNKLVPKTEEELKSEIDKLTINGYFLPKAIINRVKNDTWKTPKNKDKLEKLIIKYCPFEDEVKYLKEMKNDFFLYSLGLMKIESESLYKWLHPKWKGDRFMLLGKKDEKIYPGDIDTEKIILFGDFGHGSDTPFGLDFRENEESPIVILLYWGKNSETDNRWKKIANSFEEFEQLIWTEK